MGVVRTQNANLNITSGTSRTITNVNTIGASLIVLQISHNGTVSNVKLGTANFTLFDTSTTINTRQIWYIVAPQRNSGLSITFTTSSSSTVTICSWMAFSGADQTTPLVIAETATGTINSSTPVNKNYVMPRYGGMIMGSIGFSGSSTVNDYVINANMTGNGSRDIVTTAQFHVIQGSLYGPVNTYADTQYGFARSSSTSRTYDVILYEIMPALGAGNMLLMFM